MMKFTIAVFMLAMSGIVSAEALILATMDIRRAPTSAPLMHRTNLVTEEKKILNFKFYTGDLFTANPAAHMWVMSDGYVDASIPTDSLQGRGITIGHTNACSGVGFEWFGVNAGFKEGCVPVKFFPNEFYDLIVVTTPKDVAFRVRGPNVDSSAYLQFSGDYESYDTVVGVAGDHNTATYGLFNFHQIIGEK